MNEIEINQNVAEQICHSRTWNGSAFEAGAWIALLEGNVVAIAKDLEGALRALRALDANPKHGMIFKVGPPVIDVIR